MTQLKLIASPTFKAKVEIPVAGTAKPAVVEFTFRHRTRSDFKRWHASLNPDDGEPREDLDSVLDCIIGWDLEYDFNRENVEQLLENYHGAAFNILRAYSDELFKARVGNSVR